MTFGQFLTAIADRDVITFPSGVIMDSSLAHASTNDMKKNCLLTAWNCWSNDRIRRFQLAMLALYHAISQRYCDDMTISPP